MHTVTVLSRFWIVADQRACACDIGYNHGFRIGKPIPEPLYLVGVKHGDLIAHTSMVDALNDALDSYTNERTGLTICGVPVLGPNRVERR